MNNYLLTGKTATKLYNTVKDKPIFDYHCHLVPQEIYEDKPYKNITEMWLYHDHYKWRAMRYYGISENLVTGNADDYDKFCAYIEVLSHLLGSPLYDWTKMELQLFFGIDKEISSDNAEYIYKKCNEVIEKEKLSPRKLLNKCGVAFVGTTDDPKDDLKYHEKLQKEYKECFVAPTFRPDNAYKIDKPGYGAYISDLEKSAGCSIKSFGDLISALTKRLDYFKEHSCRSSDHSVEWYGFRELSEEELDKVFEKAVKGETLTDDETSGFKTEVIMRLAPEYKKRGLVMQLHIGAIRNNNIGIFETVGADAGCDSPNDKDLADFVRRILSSLDKDGNLPKTVLYTLNSKDFLALATQGGNYPEQGIRGKVQLGAAWWFNDHKSGIETQLETIASQSMLPEFVGMLTDSRSFLSYARHDYFRRILCSFIARYVDEGRFPESKELYKVLNGICFDNAYEFFG